MNRLLSSLILAGVAANSYAQTFPSSEEITQDIIRSATNYANAISCLDGQIEPQHIATLVPYSDGDLDAKYAVLWTGDIGCSGGSVSSFANIAIVSVGAGSSFIVNPLQSSPIIEFNSPVRYVERIVRNTYDSLVLEGKELGKQDANCCPSIPVRFTMKSDGKGNWTIIEKEILLEK